MYLYEIKAASFAKQLNELASADIDKELEKTASDIGKTKQLGQGDDTGDNPGGFGAAPDPAAGQSPLQAGEEDPLATDDPLASDATDDAEDEMLMQKVDEILIAAAKTHRYATTYNHTDNSKIHPYKILSMSIDELQSLRLMARNKFNLETFNGNVGSADNPDINFFQDLVSFADKVLDVKKSSTKEHRSKREGKTAKHEKRPESKTKAGKAKHPKAGK
jgi:hypothetical protein